MDCMRHETLRDNGQVMHQTRWRLAGADLVARWSEQPLRLHAVTLVANAPVSSHGGIGDHPEVVLASVAWLACELASRQLPLTDPLQNDLADAVLALREQLLQSAAWKDERPRDESTVTRLDGARPVKA